MGEDGYRTGEITGGSAESWEAATQDAVERAAQRIRDLRIVAEATRFAVMMKDGHVAEYRVRLKISYKHEP